MKASPLKADFSGGEISPLSQGDTQAPAYKSGVAKMLNFLPTLQKSVVRRPGTQLAYGYVNSTSLIRLIPFVFTNSQAYALEFGNLYIQFYTEEQIITPGGVPYSIASPYTQADLELLQWAQIGDTMYIVHPNHPVYVLSRFGNTNWTITVVTFIDGPYLNVNLTSTTLKVSAVSGTGITMTASAPLFAATDVGRVARFNPDNLLWGNFTITAFTSTTIVTVTANLPITSGQATVASTRWRLGLWSGTTGYPSAICFHQGRLWFGGAAGDPLGLDGSVPASYLDFTPTTAATPFTVADSNAVNDDVFSEDQDGIKWLVSNTLGLQIGTTSKELLCSAASGANNAITATDVQIVKQTDYGSCPGVIPVPAGRSTLFVQRAGRKLREMYYYYYIGGFEAEDISLMSEHMTKSGINQMAFQREPVPTLWMCLNNGKLVSMTYQRNLQELKVGWAQHQLGGQSSLGGDPPVVESLCVIPTTTAFPFADNAQDEVWMVVRRVDGQGNTLRTIEFMLPFFDQGEFALPVNATYSDCCEVLSDGYYIVGATQTNPVKLRLQFPPNNFAAGAAVTIDGVFGMIQLNGNNYHIGALEQVSVTGITKANPAVVTAAAHGHSNGDLVYITGVGGMTQVNGFNYTVAGATTNTFQLAGVDSTGFTTYTSGGTATGQHVTLVDRHGTSIDGTGFSLFAYGPNGVPGVSATGLLFPQITNYGAFTQFVSAPAVAVQADGSAQLQVPDASGNVPISPAAGFVTAGFPYNSDLQLLRFDAGSQEGTAVGKFRRTHRIAVDVLQTANLKIGFNSFSGDLQYLTKDQQGAPPVGSQLMTGLVTYTPGPDSDYSLDDFVCLRMDTPLPCTIRSVDPMMETQDRQ